MTLPVLDLFILSQLDRGCETPYDLLRQAGVSLGASTPALRRLSEAALITRIDGQGVTKRPRHHYQLTASGRRNAREGWKQYLAGSKIPADLDSILRLVDMANHYGNAGQDLAAFLKKAASQRQQAAEQAKLSRSHREELMDYVTLRYDCDVEKFAAEAAALTQIAAELTKKTPKPAQPPSLASQRRRDQSLKPSAKLSQKASKTF